MTDTPITTRQEFFARRNAAIVERYNAGEGLNAISVEFGVAEATVLQIAYSNGGKRPKRAPRKQFSERDKNICAEYLAGDTLQIVGQRHGITRERTRQILVKNSIAERNGGFFQPERMAVRIRQGEAAEKRRARKDLIADERARARQLYNAGSTYQEIADALDHSIGWAQVAVWKTGGPSRNALAQHPKKKLTPEQRKEVAQRYATGENIQVIATKFNICADHVGNIARAEGAFRARKNSPVLKAGEVSGGQQAPQPQAAGDNHSEHQVS